MAATARNEQPWEFIAVTDAQALGKIAAATDYGRFIGAAKACIALFCKDTKYYLEDGSAATQNMLVAAAALGLGACWVAGDKKAYGEQVKSLLSVPPEYRLVSLVPLGFPAGAAPHPQKRRLQECLHWEKF
jgi:nitroreductase